MFRLRPVTRLASEVRVFAGGPGLGLILMAEDAGRLAGEGGLPLPDQVQRGRTIVAVLAEGFRNNGAPNNQKDSQPGEQSGRRADEVASIAKEPHRRLALEEKARTRPCQQRAVIQGISIS